MLQRRLQFIRAVVTLLLFFNARADDTNGAAAAAILADGAAALSQRQVDLMLAETADAVGCVCVWCGCVWHHPPRT